MTWRWSRSLPNGGYSPARLAKRAACPHQAAKFPRSVGCRKKDAGNAVSVNDNIVAGTAARIFADLADPHTANSSRGGAWKSPLWQGLAESRLALARVAEQ